MGQWACIDAFSFPLQILLSRRPEWLEEPVAVLAKDDPRAPIISLNHRARRAGLRCGMRHGEALALVSHLRADTVDQRDLTQRSEEMARTLSDFSPHVEGDGDHPGTFWLDASGLCALYTDWRQWVDPLRERLRRDHDLYICVVIGFSRFATFAVARSTGRSGLFERIESERRAAGAVSLSHLDLPPSTLKATRRLGIETVDDLLAMPAEGVRRRLGEQVFRLHRRARGDLQQPHAAIQPTSTPSHTDHLDHSEKDVNRLLFLIKRHLHRLLEELKKDGEKLTRLLIALHRHGQSPIQAEISPAEPTSDVLLLIDLVRLRLETLPIDAGITDIALTASGERTTTEQMRLFTDNPPRKIEAANRALARLRAEFGPDAVLRITAHDGHLPESRFALTPLDQLKAPDCDRSEHRQAVRRFFPSPIHLRPPTAATLRTGPHTICGGWWVREVHRDYHLIETDSHRLLWVFYDHYRQRWYLHAEF